MTSLADITVVAIEQAVAAPYASGRLAEEGARVIKIERQGGDFARHYDALVLDQSAYYVWLNAGKESVMMDLTDETDSQLVHNMLAHADVFIQNLAPGAIQRLGFDLEAIRQTHPSLITCSISGYGETGPYREQKAYDLLIQAESGLCSITGIGDELTRVGVSVSDISAGMTAYQEILLALFARERDPERRGRDIEVSLFHATADWMNVPYLQHRYGHFTPGNHGLQHPSIAPYGSFTCSDGKQILISIQNEREWQSLCTVVLEQPDVASMKPYADNTRRVANRAALDALIQDVFGSLTRGQVIERLDSASIAYGRISSLADLAQHSQNRYRSIMTDQGPVEVLGRGGIVKGTTPPLNRLAGLDEHGDAIRSEFANG